MSTNSSIEWCDATWNPTRGCSRVSEGCERCYAERQAGRFSGEGMPYHGLARRAARGWRWTGEVRLVPERLADPLRWRKPRRIFCNSMSDLFHQGLDDEEIDLVLAVMLLAPHHTFQVLTKRPGRMQSYLSSPDLYERVVAAADTFRRDRPNLNRIGISDPTARPAKWIWWGVSVEDQATADERISLLLQTPAAIRFVSYEPALGPVRFCRGCPGCPNDCGWLPHEGGGIHWVIAGSESGPGARPAELDWFRSVRDQCAFASVPFFFKQWVGDHALREPGSLGPGVMRPAMHRCGGVISLPVLDDRQHAEWPR